MKTLSSLRRFYLAVTLCKRGFDALLMPLLHVGVFNPLIITPTFRMDVLS